MTSKEALENWYNTDSLRTKAYEYELHYRLIKKDLEVLEHLKQLFYGIKVLEAIGIKTTDMYDLIKNGDDNLIKEWLENDSR